MSDLEKDTPPPSLYEGERLTFDDEPMTIFRQGEAILRFYPLLPEGASLAERMLYCRNIIDGPLLPVGPSVDAVRQLLKSMPEVSAEESRHHDVVMAYKALGEISSFLSDLSADLPEPSRDLSAAISALGSALHRLSRVAEYLKAASALTPGGGEQ